MSHRPWCRPCRRHAPLYMFVGALILTGAGFGFFLVDALSPEQRLDLAVRLEAYRLELVRPDGADAAKTFLDSFLFYAGWLGLIWLLGISVIGLPGVLALDFMKGVLMGFAARLLAMEMDGGGMLLALAALVPHNALAVPALMVASVSAIRFAGWVAGERLLPAGAAISSVKIARNRNPGDAASAVRSGPDGKLSQPPAPRPAARVARAYRVIAHRAV